MHKQCLTRDQKYINLHNNLREINPILQKIIIKNKSYVPKYAEETREMKDEEEKEGWILESLDPRVGIFPPGGSMVGNQHFCPSSINSTA